MEINSHTFILVQCVRFQIVLWCVVGPLISILSRKNFKSTNIVLLSIHAKKVDSPKYPVHENFDNVGSLFAIDTS